MVVKIIWRYCGLIEYRGLSALMEKKVAVPWTVPQPRIYIPAFRQYTARTACKADRYCTFLT